MLRSVDASRREVFLKLRLPHALPYLLAAARVCVGLALIGALVAEWSGSSEGLGYTMVRAQRNLDATKVWAAVVRADLARPGSARWLVALPSAACCVGTPPTSRR